MEDATKGEAICLRTYFCDKLDGGVRFKRGDRVGYFELEGFIIITVDDYLPVSRTLFFRHFADVSDWREERINEILD